MTILLEKKILPKAVHDPAHRVHHHLGPDPDPAQDLVQDHVRAEDPRAPRDLGPGNGVNR